MLRETEEDGRKVWKEEISAGRNGRRERGNEKRRNKGETNEVMFEEGCQQWGMKRKKRK